ncbi:unnamed protein product [Sphagnum balticum]
MGATLSSLSSASAEMGCLDWVDWVDGKHFTYLTFCYRVRAIDTLYEVKIGSAYDADNTQWKQISDEICKYDDEMSHKQATLNAAPRTQTPQLADYKPLRGAAIT